jgi:hypothetical protein
MLEPDNFRPKTESTHPRPPNSVSRPAVAQVANIPDPHPLKLPVRSRRAFLRSQLTECNGYEQKRI